MPWLLVVTVLAVFGRTGTFDFIHFDEDRQLVDNPAVRSISPASIVRIFTDSSAASYYPVRVLSFAVEYRVWGLDPRGYHLTNVLIHLANVLLVYALVRRLGEARGVADPRRREGRATHIGAFVAAGLFAVHPVVVEPVAWVAGREELLMVLFGLGCVHFHLRARMPDSVTRASIDPTWWHIPAALCCAAACMSNAVAAIIPALVLAGDLCLDTRRSAVRLIGGTWFLFAIAAATVVVKRLTEQIATATGILTPPIDLDPFTRALLVASVYFHNLRSLVWPAHLSLLYPNRVPASVAEPGVAIGIALIVLTVVALWLVRRRRVVLFGLLWFVLALAPSSQAIPHHVFNADRFLYLPLVGLAVALGTAVAAWSVSVRRPVAAFALGSAVLVALAARSALQVPVWRDSMTVFSHCLRLHPRSALAYANRGEAWRRQGDICAALADYDRAIEFDPSLTEAYVNRGTAYARLGDPARAIAEYDRALALRPNDSEAYYNRGLARAHLGEHDRAIQDFSRAIALKPGYAPSYNNRAQMYRLRGDLSLAIEDLNRAIALDPSLANAWWNRGRARAGQGDLPGAAADFQRVISLAPEHVDALVDLGQCLLQRGRTAEAMRHLREALQRRPDSAEIMNLLAWALATEPDPQVRDGGEALRLASRACEATGHRSPPMLDTLAAAHAEVGQFDEAVGVARTALELATAAQQQKLAAEIQARLRLYEAGQPYRSEPK